MSDTPLGIHLGIVLGTLLLDCVANEWTKYDNSGHICDAVLRSESNDFTFQLEIQSAVESRRGDKVDEL